MRGVSVTERAGILDHFEALISVIVLVSLAFGGLVGIALARMCGWGCAE